MSVSEITFHHLVRVNVASSENHDNWLDLELINKDGNSILITIFAVKDREQRGFFNALKNCLNAEFNLQQEPSNAEDYDYVADDRNYDSSRNR